MALPEAPSADVGSGKASGGESAAGDQCHSLYSEDRLPVATTAARVSGLDGVYYHFSRWFCNGTWERLHHLLRARLREKCGRHKHPMAGCLDSQSVKCTAVPGARGFDARKLIKGRKHHILVDTLGLLLVVVVTVASVQDRDGSRLSLRQLPGCCKKLRKIWVDGGYSGRLVAWVAERFKFCLAVVLRPKQTRQFVLLPRR
jgi:putative transposase